MDKGYSPFTDEEEVIIRDSKALWITGMEHETYEVYGKEQKVLTVYFNAYRKSSEEDRFNKIEYGKDYSSIC